MALIQLHEGDRIHLKTMNGMYTVIKVYSDGVAITAKSWIARANHPKFIPWKFVKYEDIKCLANGGRFRYKAKPTVDIEMLEPFAGQL